MLMNSNTSSTASLYPNGVNSNTYYTNGNIQRSHQPFVFNTFGGRGNGSGYTPPPIYNNILDSNSFINQKSTKDNPFNLPKYPSNYQNDTPSLHQFTIQPNQNYDYVFDDDDPGVDEEDEEEEEENNGCMVEDDQITCPIIPQSYTPPPCLLDKEEEIKRQVGETKAKPIELYDLTGDDEEEEEEEDNARMSSSSNNNSETMGIKPRYKAKPDEILAASTNLCTFRRKIEDATLYTILSIMIREKDKTECVYLVDSQFSSQFMNKECTDRDAKSMKKLFHGDYNVILIPLHHRDHWSLLVYLKPIDKFYYADSLSSFHYPYVQSFLLRLYEKGIFDFIQYRTEFMSIVCPTQHSNWECGHYVMLYVNQFIKSFTSSQFEQKAMEFYGFIHPSQLKHDHIISYAIGQCDESLRQNAINEIGLTILTLKS